MRAANARFTIWNTWRGPRVSATKPGACSNHCASMRRSCRVARRSRSLVAVTSRSRLTRPTVCTAAAAKRVMPVRSRKSSGSKRFASEWLTTQTVPTGVLPS